MLKRIMLIDGNSLGHQANNTRVLKIGDQETQAIYGFLNIFRSLMKQFVASKPVVLWDGAGWRKDVLSSYKEIREREETEAEKKMQERKRSYAVQRPYIQQALAHLGIPQLQSINMEADDLAGILTNRYSTQKVTTLLVTGDRDWLQLVSPRVAWYDQVGRNLVTITKFPEFTGVDTPKQFVEMKALCGDAGDSVPGVGGIGAKGAIEFLKKYGSVADFYQAVSVEKSIDPKSLHKKYRDLALDEDKIFNFKRNMSLVDLNTPLRPQPKNLMNNPGSPNAAEFSSFCDMFLFNSITRNLAEWLEPLPTYQQMMGTKAA